MGSKEYDARAGASSILVQTMVGMHELLWSRERRDAAVEGLVRHCSSQ